ncbi:MauE/DoxX family redox-associated membrane protein [Actinorugispora endophytica]|uniref:Methylamine utilization protein MauE n=1 Tax=Actinorugispora endophytica TaxID=1605990 RepID=A0A4R6UNK6_9ACTN|nr:MauE/DoxX family redox-associated membrane protein [Actinorugispora endophytica]TDQ48521.1 methylamine utilization protein MauE [Actinorugispora endophytica]
MSTDTEENTGRDRELRQRPATRWETVQPWATLAARLALAGVVGYAGYTKVIVPALSVQSVQAYQLFGDDVSRFIGYTLPLFEIALALLLVLGLATRLTGIVGALLMGVFIAGIASAWARGLNIDCGCFGTGGPVAEGETAYGLDIARDLGFMALGLFVAVWPRSPFSVDRVLGLYPGRDQRR